MFKIDRKALASQGVAQFVVSELCAPSVPEDDEVVLVVGNGFHLPPAVIIELIKVSAPTDGTV